MRTVQTLSEQCVLTLWPGLSQSCWSSGPYPSEYKSYTSTRYLQKIIFNALEVQWASLITDNLHINAHYDHVIAPYINTFSSFHFLYPSFSVEPFFWLMNDGSEHIDCNSIPKKLSCCVFWCFKKCWWTHEVKSFLQTRVSHGSERQPDVAFEQTMIRFDYQIAILSSVPNRCIERSTPKNT